MVVVEIQRFRVLVVDVELATHHTLQVFEVVKVAFTLCPLLQGKVHIHLSLVLVVDHLRKHFSLLFRLQFGLSHLMVLLPRILLLLTSFSELCEIVALSFNEKRIVHQILIKGVLGLSTGE